MGQIVPDIPPDSPNANKHNWSFRRVKLREGNDSLSISRIQTSSLMNSAIDKIFIATCQRHAKVDD